MSDQLETGDDAVNGEEAYTLWDDGEKYNPTRHGSSFLIKNRWNCSVALFYWGKRCNHKFEHRDSLVCIYVVWAMEM
jgi:hypothetical protein